MVIGGWHVSSQSGSARVCAGQDKSVVTQHTLLFNFRTSPFDTMGHGGQLTGDAETLLFFLTPYVEGCLKADTIRSIVLQESDGLWTGMAEFPEDMYALKRRLRELAVMDRVAVAQ